VAEPDISVPWGSSRLLTFDLSPMLHLLRMIAFCIMHSAPIMQFPRMMELEIFVLAPILQLRPITLFWIMQPSPIEIESMAPSMRATLLSLTYVCWGLTDIKSTMLFGVVLNKDWCSCGSYFNL